MATSPPQKGIANVQHDFNGDVKFLNSTFNQRKQIRQLLIDLQRDLSKIESRATRVTAKITIQVSGPDAKDHMYNVSVTDSAFDRTTLPERASATGSSAAGAHSDGIIASPPVSGHMNGRQPLEQSSPGAMSGKHGQDAFLLEDDEQPQRKRAKIQSSDTDALLRETVALLRQRPQPDEVLAFAKEWHTQWSQQGGWLFDTLTKSSTAATDNKLQLEKKLGTVQDILGQSLNAQSQSLLAEMGNLTKLIPWLEHCRKTNADKVQQREEKWRSSSATFHDQNRKDRETAEGKLLEQLEAQQKLLEKQQGMLRQLMQAEGLSGEETPDAGVSVREESLEAQLTKELNMVADKEDAAEQESREDVPASRNQPNVDEQDD